MEGNPAFSRYFGLVTSVIVAVSKVNRYGLATTAVFQLSAQCFSLRRRSIRDVFMAYPPGRPMGNVTGKFEECTLSIARTSNVTKVKLSLPESNAVKVRPEGQASLVLASVLEKHD